MGNKASNDGGRIPRSLSDRGSSSMLTSAEEIEAWLPDSMEKVKAGTLPANRDVDWDDENNVMRETQVSHEHLQTAFLQPMFTNPSFWRHGMPVSVFSSLTYVAQTTAQYNTQLGRGAENLEALLQFCRQVGEP
jgi:hypothetical protein